MSTADTAIFIHSFLYFENKTQLIQFNGHFQTFPDSMVFVLAQVLTFQFNIKKVRKKCAKNWIRVMLVCKLSFLIY